MPNSSWERDMAKTLRNHDRSTQPFIHHPTRPQAITRRRNIASKHKLNIINIYFHFGVGNIYLITFLIAIYALRCYLVSIEELKPGLQGTVYFHYGVGDFLYLTHTQSPQERTYIHCVYILPNIHSLTSLINKRSGVPIFRRISDYKRIGLPPRTRFRTNSIITQPHQRGR